MDASATTVRRRRARPARGARRVGYLFGALFNGLFLWLLHVWPGWDAVPFLTPQFADVLEVVSLPLWLGIGANLVYVVSDPRWLTALGAVVTTAVGLVAAIRLWQVFPFDLSDAWTVVFRVCLVLGIVGSAIGVLVNAGACLRALATRDGRTAA